MIELQLNRTKSHFRLNLGAVYCHISVIYVLIHNNGWRQCLADLLIWPGIGFYAIVAVIKLNIMADKWL